MARHNDPHTASAQWYINLSDNKQLDPSARRWGYAVFGRVLEGIEVVERIGQVETGARGPFPSDVPAEPIVVRHARVIDPPETTQ
jgi:cyclophilin family peptidyl-prolyl cis-trans isomerase